MPKDDLEDLLGKTIEVEISGGVFRTGTLVDSGLDIIVLYDGKKQSFLYIPFIYFHESCQMANSVSTQHNSILLK
ncbi:hypothetical protein [Neobacillus cucumis]|uniref:hypothetical protein n=1 Tax=Neobacillus cucumis TaxID=1740721 RepID=UPI0035A3B6F5